MYSKSDRISNCSCEFVSRFADRNWHWLVTSVSVDASVQLKICGSNAFEKKNVVQICTALSLSFFFNFSFLFLFLSVVQIEQQKVAP